MFNCRKITITLLYLIVGTINLFATANTEGKAFYVTFPRNESEAEGSPALTLALIVSATQTTTVTVLNPQTQWEESFQVEAGQVTHHPIPHEQCYTFAYGQVQKRGLYITATKPISLYASSFVEHSYDATIVLPVTALGNDYILQTYDDQNQPREATIVATDNNTQITIIPHAQTTDNHPKDIPYTITLNQGETYQIMSFDPDNAFSGTRLQANHPFALFGGHQCANVPSGNAWCDHLFEQQTPTDQWGKHFVVTASSDQKGDRVRLTARYDNTNISINGNNATTLQALQTYEWRMTDSCAYVETDQPVACYLYLEGAQAHNMNSDPSMVHISPIEQRVKEITFATFQTTVSRIHFLNIVTTKEGAEKMLLDGKNIGYRFRPVPSTENLYFTITGIPHGTHTLSTEIDGFTGHVYGIGWCESYAYTIGSATLPLTAPILINNTPYANTIDTDPHCYLQPITFQPHSSLSFDNIQWLTGDGYTTQQTTFTHTYTAPGDYNIQMITSQGSQQDTANTILHLTQTLYDTLQAVFCAGETYTIGDQTFRTSGQYTVTLTSDNGCDSLVTLNLTVRDTFLTSDTIHARKGTPTRWHSHWYRDAGNYYDTLPSIYGCDSICRLTLILDDPSETMYDTLCWQPTYTFHNYNFTLPSINGYEEEDYLNYSLEYRDKEACITYRMHLAIIPQLDGQTTEQYDTIVRGMTYSWFNQTIIEEGIYYHTEELACNCQHHYILHLAFLPFPVEEDTLTLCHEDTVYFLDKPYTQPGSYRDTIATQAGVESIHNITVIEQRTQSTETVTDVPSYTWQGIEYIRTGTYYDTIPNNNGCDSLLTLRLTIDPNCYHSVEEEEHICQGDSYTWHGSTYNRSGNYTYRLRLDSQCDTLYTLHLTVNPTYHISAHNTILCHGDTLLWNEQTYTQSGTYTQTLSTIHGCDSVVTRQLTILPAFASHAYLTDTICADDPWLPLYVEITQGQWQHYSLSFEEKALQQGFKNITAEQARNNTIQLPVPFPDDPTHYVRPDDYTLQLTLQDTCGAILTHNMQFTIIYPSWIIVQKWNDVLALLNDRYNGGYEFSRIRWFREGQEIEGNGEHNSYLYTLPNLAFGNAYWALLTRADDGKTLPTCIIRPYDKYLNNNTPTIRLVATDNETHSWSVITDESGTYRAYDATGKEVQQGVFGNNYNATLLQLPASLHGVVIIIFHSDTGNEQIIKLLCQ